METWDGAFAFLLTDIEASTRLWEDAPADMARALARHDDLISDTVGAHGGTLVRSRGEGDSAFAVFDESSDAILAALTLQREFAAEPWPANANIRVRMAVHTGQAQRRRDDYYGPAVNRAARLRGAEIGRASCRERV